MLAVQDSYLTLAVSMKQTLQHWSRGIAHQITRVVEVIVMIGIFLGGIAMVIEVIHTISSIKFLIILFFLGMIRVLEKSIAFIDHVIITSVLRP